MQWYIHLFSILVTYSEFLMSLAEYLKSSIFKRLNVSSHYNMEKIGLLRLFRTATDTPQYVFFIFLMHLFLPGHWSRMTSASYALVIHSSQLEDYPYASAYQFTCWRYFSRFVLLALSSSFFCPPNSSDQHPPPLDN